MSGFLSTLNRKLGSVSTGVRLRREAIFLKRGILWQVQIGHMAAALSTTFKSAVVQTIQSLPQHQQVRNCLNLNLNTSTASYFRGSCRPSQPSLRQSAAVQMVLCSTVRQLKGRQKDASLVQASLLPPPHMAHDSSFLLTRRPSEQEM